MSDQAAAGPPTEERKLLAAFVRSRVSALQHGYLHPETRAGADARGALAELRRVPVDSMTSDFSALLATLDGFPRSLVGHGDTPTRWERAAHAAIVLYAVHQQSQSVPVHQASDPDARVRRTLGQAAGVLARQGEGLNEGVVRRFKVIASASTVDEALHHLADFISLLRSADHPVPLDYGRLATDIADLHFVQGRERVQLAWARDFHGVPASADSTHPLDPTTAGDPS